MRWHKLVLGLALASCATFALAKNNGEWDYLPDNAKDWFKSLRAPGSHISCCDVADGHATQWRKSHTAGIEYDVVIEGEWVPVPADAFIDRNDNPTGEAIVWYRMDWESGEDGQYTQPLKPHPFIRCFIMGSGA